MTLDLEAIRERNWRTLRHAGHDCGEAAQAAADFAALLAALEEARRERDNYRKLWSAGVEQRAAEPRDPEKDAAESALWATFREMVQCAEADLAAARAEVEQLRQRLDLAEGRIDGDAWDRLTAEREEARATVRRAMGAIKDGAATAAAVALAICSRGDGQPDVFDELAAARAEVERMRQERDDFRAAAERTHDQLVAAGWASVADLHAAYVDVLGRWQRSEAVLEAARALRAAQRRDRLPPGTTKEELFAMVEAYAPIARAFESAVDTYEGTDYAATRDHMEAWLDGHEEHLGESQEGTDERG